MKKLLAVLLTTLLLAVSAGAFAEDLIMGTNAEFPPYEYVEADGTIDGLDVAIGRLIAEKTGKDLVVDNREFDGLIMALSNGEIDMILSGMTIKPDRLEQIDFSDPYITAWQDVIVLEGNEDIKSLDDLKDKVVGVQEGTTGHYLATDTLGLSEGSQVITYKAAALGVLELLQGRLDAVIIDSAPAAVFVASNEGLKVVEGIETETEYYAVGIKKGNTELLEAVNAVIAEITEDGTLEAIIDEYYNIADDEPANDDTAAN